MGKSEAVGSQRADRGLAVGCRLSPHPGLSLGEEGVLRPAWNSKAALTHPAAGFLAKQGACLPLPEGEGRGEGERRMVDQEAIRAWCRPLKSSSENFPAH